MMWVINPWWPGEENLVFTLVGYFFKTLVKLENRNGACEHLLNYVKPFSGK